MTACTGFFFQPLKQMFRTPADLGLVYDDVYFESMDGLKLHGWFLPAKGEAKGTVLFYHGNAENISTHIGSVYWMPEQGFNVFLFDYRGYGLSAGIPQVDGVHADGYSALNYLQSRKDIDKDKIIVFGQSVGGAIAIYIVGTQEVQGVKGVIIEGSFSEYRKIARHVMSGSPITWLLQWPLSFTISNQYSPADVVGNISPIPLLLVHGTRDGIIPLEHSEQLFAEAKEPKELWVIENASHITAFYINKGEYRPKLADEMNRMLSQ